jgi:hypothetical protein
MSRRIVFAGGTQTRAIARLYRSDIAGATGDDVMFVGSGAAGTEAARSALLLADIIVLEIDEDGDALPAGDMPTTAQLVRLPNLYCDYLWPFAGRSHPKNRGTFALAGGPYPAEHGDRFLDQMLAEGVDEDEAIRRYLAMDVVREGELDSRLEDRNAIHSRLDEAGEFSLAGYIADNFRAEPLFRTRQRITIGLLRRVMGQLLPKLGVHGFEPERITRVPFSASAQPVHPGVAKHFGLSWVGAGQLYPVNQEGFFDFEAFCRRYMRFTWNEALHRGIEKVRTAPADALADLEQGLAESPDSPLGARALAAARYAVGLTQEPPPPALLDEDSYDPDEDPLPAPKPAPIEAAEAEALEPESAEANEAEPEHAATADAEDEPEEAASDAEHDDAADTEDALAGLKTSFAAPPPVPPAGAQRDISFGTTHDGFTDFGPPGGRKQKADVQVLAAPGNELIDVLPRLLPVFTDLSGGAERPFSTMPEVMPPPPLRPILPPELQGEAPKQGFFGRLMGRKTQ